MREKWEDINEFRKEERELGEEFVDRLVRKGVFAEVTVQLGGGEVVIVNWVRIKVGGRKGRGHMEVMLVLNFNEGKEMRRVLFRCKREQGWKYHRIEKYDSESLEWLRVPPREAVETMTGWKDVAAGSLSG